MRESFVKAIDSNQQDIWYWYNYADELINLNRFNDALVALHSDGTVDYYELDCAITAYKAAIQQRPGYTAALYNLGMLYQCTHSVEGLPVWEQYLEASQDLADVLEVYLLCLLLGFQGRYSATNRDELGLWTSRVREQVTRIRGGTPPLAPDWAIPTGEVLPRTRDPWLQRLIFAGAATLAVAIALYVIYFVVLRSGGTIA